MLEFTIHDRSNDLNNAHVLVTQERTVVTLNPHLIVSQPFDAEAWELIEFSYTQEQVHTKAELTVKDCIMGLLDDQLHVVKTVPALDTEVPTHHATASAFRASLYVQKIEELVDEHIKILRHSSDYV